MVSSPVPTPSGRGGPEFPSPQYPIPSPQIKAIALQKSDRYASTDNLGGKAYFIVAKTGATSGSAILGANNPLA